MNKRSRIGPTPTEVLTHLGIVGAVVTGWSYLVVVAQLNEILRAIGIVTICFVDLLWLWQRNGDHWLSRRIAEVALEKCNSELSYLAKEMLDEAGPGYLSAARQFERGVKIFLENSRTRRRHDEALLKEIDPADRGDIREKFARIKDSVEDSCLEALSYLSAPGRTNETARPVIDRAGQKVREAAIRVRTALDLL